MAALRLAWRGAVPAKRIQQAEQAASTPYELCAYAARKQTDKLDGLFHSESRQQPSDGCEV